MKPQTKAEQVRHQIEIKAAYKNAIECDHTKATLLFSKGIYDEPLRRNTFISMKCLLAVKILTYTEFCPRRMFRSERIVKLYLS